MTRIVPTMLGVTLLILSRPAWAKSPDTKVCVEVVVRHAPKPNKKQAPASRPSTVKAEEVFSEQVQSPEKKPRRLTVPRSPRTSAAVNRSLLPFGHTPQAYLERLVEHFITHKKGFVAVDKGCKERISIELYPLNEGWTVFARYSGHGREERVDQLFADELSQFAERAVSALLDDAPISTTIKRDTVLRADSPRSPRTIDGSHHFMLSLGTQLRGGSLSTAGSSGEASKELRLITPMLAAAGYRGRFENWGIEATLHFALAAQKTAIAKNRAGGHVDPGGAGGVALHFLRYVAPRGVTSLYFGAGATIELMWFSVIKAEDQRLSDNRSTLISGGLDVDLVVGYEFMRASSIQFLLQAELNLPAYAVDTENDDGGIATWYPGATIKLGVLF